MNVLADAAPTGAGLAIVGVILLALFAVFVGLTIFVTVKIVKFVRRRRGPAAPAPVPTPPA